MNRRMSLSSSLLLDLINLRLQLLRVRQVTVPHHLHLLVKLVHQRNRCRNVQLYNFFFIYKQYLSSISCSTTWQLLEANSREPPPPHSYPALLLAQLSSSSMVTLCRLLSLGSFVRRKGTYVRGSNAGSTSLYFLSNFGCLWSFSSNSGGGISKDLLQTCTCSFPCFSTV